MSLPSIPNGRDSTRSSSEKQFARRIRALVSALFFWTATLLPLVLLTLLATGLETASDIVAFLGLLALNAVAFVAGHSHSPA